MHPLLTLVCVALCAVSVSGEFQLKLKRTFDASNFFDEFNFIEGHDRFTHGFATYVSKSEALASRLASTSNGKVRLGVDSTTHIAFPRGTEEGVTSGKGSPKGGRKTIRLESKAEFEQGLLVVDFDKVPASVCGIWPAFWLLHDDMPPAPFYSEIDLYEGISHNRANEITLFTSSQPCELEAGAQTGETYETKCRGPNFSQLHSIPPSSTLNPSAKRRGELHEESCGVHAADGTFGDDINRKGGAVWALLVADDRIKVWHFDRNNVPEDLHVKNEIDRDGQLGKAAVDPDKWGKPVMDFSEGACDIAKAWRKMKIVINITFCGSYAGDAWSGYTECNKKTRHDTCEAFVAGNPNAFKDGSFSINSVKLFERL